jgi:hypothetical protein
MDPGTLGVALALALALGWAGASGWAPVPEAITEPMALMRSMAVIGFTPSVTTAPAELGGAGDDVAGLLALAPPGARDCALPTLGVGGAQFTFFFGAEEEDMLPRVVRQTRSAGRKSKVQQKRSWP